MKLRLWAEAAMLGKVKINPDGACFRASIAGVRFHTTIQIG